MTLSFAHIVWIVVLMLSSFFAGWLLRRLRALEREAELEAAFRETQQRAADADADRADRQQHLTLLKRNLEAETSATAALETSLRRKSAELTTARQALLEAKAETRALKEATGAVPASPASLEGPGAQSAVNEALTQALAERDRRLLHVEVELARRAGAVGDLEARMNEERARADAGARTIEERDGSIATQNATISSLNEEVDKWRQRVPKLAESLKGREATLLERQQTIDALNGTLTELRQERDSARNGALQAAERGQSLLEQLDSARNELDSIRTALKDENARLAKRNEALDRDANAFGAEVEMLRKERYELVRAADGLRVELTAREQSHHALEVRHQSLEERNLEIETRHQALEARHQALDARRQALDGRRQVLETRLEALVSEHAALATAHSDTTHELETQRAQWVDERERLNSTLAAMEAERGGHALQLVAFERRAREGADVRAAEQTELHERIEAASAAERQVQDVSLRMSHIEGLLHQRDAELLERASRIESLQAQIAKLDTTLGERSARIAALERDATQRPGEEADPRGEYLEKRLIGQIDKNHELTRALAEKDRQITASTREKSLHEKSLGVLTQQLQDSRLENERLAVRLNGGQGETQGGSGAAADEPPTTPPPTDDREDDGWERAADADNLQAIRGIGRSFERRLNELGVSRLSQIVNLDEEDIAWLERELDMFTGRIGRDDWVGQAAALIADSGELERPLPPNPDSRPVTAAQP